MNLTFNNKYIVHQVSSNNYHHYTAPLLDLKSKVELELINFYDWSLKQVQETVSLMNSDFLPNAAAEDKEYFEEVAEECQEWFEKECKDFIQNLRQKLTPYFVQINQLEEIRDSMARLKERWEDMRVNIQFIEEFEDIFNWLLDLPYLLKKRLETFKLISDYHSISYSQMGPVTLLHQELNSKVNVTSPTQTCHFYYFNEGCAV
ncbi:hypothetical protein [Rossellomorea vietnamensis]|uniref:hypothetical protein n=1 Tax=Rossellomorea vietnamensis TaxID=218284 RepID=UPI00054D2FDF|nr:hypothetical protein [Rossellomorea vietnamensis]